MDLKKGGEDIGVTDLDTDRNTTGAFFLETAYCLVTFVRIFSEFIRGLPRSERIKNTKSTGNLFCSQIR